MTVGQRIKNRREELKLSQGDLAKKMSVSRQAISKAELHDNNITTEKVRKFAKALDCTEAYLMGWDEHPNSEMVSALERSLEQHPEDKTLQYLHRGLKIDSVTKNITEDELKFVEAYRTLDEESKRQLGLMLAFLKDHNNKQ